MPCGFCQQKPFVLFATERLHVDLTSMMVLLSLLVTGVLTSVLRLF
jgi:hypothetical protein